MALYGRKMREAERRIIEDALAQSDGVEDAAKLLGLPRRTLYGRMKALGIERRRYRSSEEKADEVERIANELYAEVGDKLFTDLIGGPRNRANSRSESERR